MPQLKEGDTVRARHGREVVEGIVRGCAEVPEVAPFAIIETEEGMMLAPCVPGTTFEPL